MTPAARPQPPSGRQHRLVCGDQEAVVTEVGATLRGYVVAGLPVLDGFDEDRLCTGARGQLLLPWPNRVGDGRYRFAGEEHQLPLDEPERLNALHGLTRWDAWSAEPHAPGRLTMRHTLHPRPGYPFRLELTADYALGEQGLAVTVTCRNPGGRPVPFGAGAHPYLRLDTPSVDELRLRVPAATVLVTDSRSLPVGRTGVEGTDLDFRELRRIGDARLDHCFTDLAPDPDGVTRVLLESPSGRSLALWLDGTQRWVQLFTGDGLAEAEQRRSVAVEPMTCPPDALRSGEDLVLLGPGEATSVRWGIDVRGLHR
jgi:aldose 1-epimerase